MLILILILFSVNYYYHYVNIIIILIPQKTSGFRRRDANMPTYGFVRTGFRRWVSRGRVFEDGFPRMGFVKTGLTLERLGWSPKV